MEIKDVITLLNAGFTKEDIANFFSGNAPEQTPQVAPQVVPEPVPTPQVVPEPVPTPQVAPAPSVEELNAYTERIVALENENAELRKANQTLALLRDSAPAPMNSAELEQKGIDALASIIRPTINDNKGVI